MIHEELINLKEEDVFIREHKKHIDDMVESIKDEMDYIHEVDKPGSNIEEYTSNLDKLLYKEIQIISQLRKRLNKFRILFSNSCAFCISFNSNSNKLFLYISMKISFASIVNGCCSIRAS